MFSLLGRISWFTVLAVQIYSVSMGITMAWAVMDFSLLSLVKIYWSQKHMVLKIESYLWLLPKLSFNIPMKLKSTNWPSKLCWPNRDKVLMSLIFVEIPLKIRLKNCLPIDLHWDIIYWNPRKMLNLMNFWQSDCAVQPSDLAGVKDLLL